MLEDWACSSQVHIVEKKNHWLTAVLLKFVLIKCDIQTNEQANGQTNHLTEYIYKLTLCAIQRLVGYGSIYSAGTPSLCCAADVPLFLPMIEASLGKLDPEAAHWRPRVLEIAVEHLWWRQQMNTRKKHIVTQKKNSHWKAISVVF